ncbi:MAG: DUF2399 domain-containing protein [Chitinispirillaceae bacterium]|nr:DUF2399 domain-containing protein [Chitinispirillaceae bacterium]
MNSKEHFTFCLKKYPDSITYCQLLCSAWKKYGRMPERLTLKSNSIAIEHSLVEMFGRRSLNLSRNGTVTLITSRLFEHSSKEDIEQWIKDLHETAGIPFTRKISNEEISAGYDVAVQKWKLMFPELSTLSPLLTPSYNKPPDELLNFWIVAAEIVRFLENNSDAITVSDLGARFCSDSKALRGGELISTVTDWLVFLDTGLQVNTSELDSAFKKSLRQQSLELHGVVENRCVVPVAVFGPLLVHKYGQVIDHVKKMWSMGESALLSLDNLQNADRIEIPDNYPVYLCENESPFANLIRQKHQGVLIYTKGFPNAAVCALYKLITSQYPAIERFHWGDTDLAGLQIAAIFNKIAPLRLWRCDIDDVMRYKDSLIKIGKDEKERIVMFLDNNPHFPFRDVLSFTCEYGWLEQERFTVKLPKYHHSEDLNK